MARKMHEANYKNQPILCNGRLFPTHNALASHYGMNRCTIRQRLRSGLSVEEAVAKPVKTLRRPSWTECGKRICATCGVVLEKARNRQANCAPCKLRYSAEHRVGVPQGTHLTLWEQQQGRCLCCQDSFQNMASQRAPHLDHCHETGRVRGLLCNRCNTSLGLIQESRERALALVDYIDNYCTPLKEGKL